MKKIINNLGLAGILFATVLFFNGCEDTEESLFKKISIIADKKGDNNAILDIGELTGVYKELNLDYNTMNPEELSVEQMKKYILNNKRYLSK